MSEQPLTVPDDVPEDWHPDGYTPGPDDPGDVDTECGPGDVDSTPVEDAS